MQIKASPSFRDVISSRFSSQRLTNPVKELCSLLTISVRLSDCLIHDLLTCFREAEVH